MKFLVDAQLPRALCAWLRDRGHVAVHVADIGMVSAHDTAIADLAASEAYILVSKDEDFVTLRLPDRFALLWLRCGNASNLVLAKWIEGRWNDVDVLIEANERFIEVR